MNQLRSIKGMCAALRHSAELVKFETFSWRVKSSPSVTNSHSNKQRETVPILVSAIQSLIKQKVLRPARVVYWFLYFYNFWRFCLVTLAERDGLLFCLCGSLFIVPESSSRAKALVKTAVCPWLIFITVSLSHASHIDHFISTINPWMTECEGGLRCAVRTFTVKFYCIDIGWKWCWTAAPTWLNAFIHSKNIRISKAGDRTQWINV